MGAWVGVLALAGFALSPEQAAPAAELTGHPATPLVTHTVSSQGYCFQVELAWQLERAGGRIVEHPIAFTERENGRSKMHAGIVTEALVRVTGWGLTRGLRK